MPRIFKSIMAVAGRLPSEYKELDHAILTNNAYFKTGIQANPAFTNSKLRVCPTIVDSTRGLYGARATTSSTTRSYNIFSNVVGARGRFDNTQSSQPYTFVANSWYEIELGHDGLKGTATVNGTLLNGDKNMVNEEVGEIYIGNFNNISAPYTSGTPSKWGEVEIYADGTTLSGYFIPCKHSSGVVGIYDLCNSRDNLFHMVLDGTPVNVGIANEGVARWATGSAQSRSFVLRIEPNTDYNISVQGTFEGAMFRVATTAEECTSTRQSVNTIAHINKTTYSATTINSGANARYMYIQFSAANINSMKNILMVVKGTTTPLEYECHPFHTNAGAGDVTAGPEVPVEVVEVMKRVIVEDTPILPDGHTELGYIKGDGNAFINTPVTSYKNTYTFKFGIRRYDATTKFVALQNPNESIDSIGMFAHATGFYVQNGKRVLQRVSITVPLGEFHDIVIERDGVTVDGTKTSFTAASQFTISQILSIFAGRDPTTAAIDARKSANAYSYFQLYDDNNNLILDLVPAKNSSNAVGMYDLVTGQFVTNADTGNFIAGPEVHRQTAREIFVQEIPE